VKHWKRLRLRTRGTSLPRMRFWMGSAAAALVLAGCGGKQEAKTPTPTSVEATPQVVEEAPDLSPVKRPAEVAVIGRIARPRQLVETLAKWSSLPLRIEDMMPEDARPLASVVLWEAPVEMVVALDAFGEGKLPPPLLVGSLGLKSLDEALRAAERLQMPTRKVAAGVYRVGDFPDVSCSVAMSLGAAPARLVCGRTVKDVDTLLPYVTRGLPSEPPSGADFELTLDAKPIQDKYTNDVAALRLIAGIGVREVALDNPRFDKALSDVIYGAVDETINLFADLDQIRLDARIDAARNVLTASGELKLKGQSSWVAGTIAASKPAALPADLPRLPPGAGVAAYATAMPAERYAAIGRILGDLAEGFLEHQKVPEASRKRAHRLVDGWFAKLPENVGFVAAPAQLDAESYLRADTTVTRFSEPSPRILALYNDLFAFANDAALKRWAKDKHQISEKFWPKVTKKPLKLPGFKAPATAFEVIIDSKAWGEVDASWGKALDNALPPVDAKGLRRFTLVVQPDGAYTYAMSGDDSKEIARVIAEAKKSEPGAVFVKPARNDKVLVAGFLTLAHLGRYLARSAKEPALLKAVQNTPNHGLSAISFSSTTGPGSARFDLEVPAAAFTDVSAAAAQSGPALRDALKKQ
jgi:hypothetical protein